MGGGGLTTTEARDSLAWVIPGLLAKRVEEEDELTLRVEHCQTGEKLAQNRIKG